MALPRPSLTLILDIDESLDSEDLRLEIARCYSHVGSTLVRTHGREEGAGAENVIRFLVKLGQRSYLLSDEEGADELWDEVMVRWFSNELRKVGLNMRTFNRRQEKIGNPELHFDWAELELEDGRLSAFLHCDTASGLDAQAGVAALRAMRDALNAGKLGALDDESGVKRVWMPSRASWAAQAEAGRIAAEKRKEEEAAEEARRAAEEAEAREAAEESAEEAFLESPELVAEQEREQEQKKAEEASPLSAAIEEAEEFDPEVEYALPEPDFEVDYSQCTVEAAGGAKKDVSLDLAPYLP